MAVVMETLLALITVAGAAAEGAVGEAASETAQASRSVGLVDLPLIIGVAVFAVWAVRSRGVRSLRFAPVRRTRITLLTPFALMGVWLMAASVSLHLVQPLVRDSQAWQYELTTYLALSGVLLVMIALTLLWARRSFVRGLAGLGLRLGVRRTGRDFAWAIVNLVAAYPVVLVGVALVMWLGRLYVGGDFRFEENEGLTAIRENPGPYARAVLLAFTILIVPVWEELLFRGMFQSAITALTRHPWVGIITASIPFAVLHPPMHIPAMLVLSCCMGYAYERSGSLVRSILVHMIFNAVNVVGMLSG